MAVSDSARERILHLLKTKGPQTAQQLARRLKVTPMAVRQHLYGLDDDGLVAYTDERRKVGRPARVWRVTDDADAFFPDSHSELAVGVLDAVRACFGMAGLDRLVAERTRRQIAEYTARMARARTLKQRLAALTRIRCEEGYMAEYSKQRDGSYLLAENHCPICAAAETCQGLCAGELELFRAILGEDATVERTEHLLAGARRCAYRIRPFPA